MKQIRNLLASVLLLIGVAISAPGCYETHYYHDYHHHTRGWYEHRHTPPPSGVNFEIDVYHGHRHHHH